jgi:hypothetical protein
VKPWLPEISCAVWVLVSGCVAASARGPAAADAKSTGAIAADQLSVQFDNGLDACVLITPAKVETVRNVVVLGARMRMLQSIAACGCRTALLGYRVRLDDPWRSGVVGRFNTLNRPLSEEEQVYLLLATDAPLLQQARRASITVMCIAENE